PAEQLDRLRDRAERRLLVAELDHEPWQLVHRRTVGDGDGGALVPERDRDREADSGRAAGHERTRTVQPGLDHAGSGPGSSTPALRAASTSRSQVAPSTATPGAAAARSRSGSPGISTARPGSAGR